MAGSTQCRSEGCSTGAMKNRAQIKRDGIIPVTYSLQPIFSPISLCLCDDVSSQGTSVMEALSRFSLRVLYCVLCRILSSHCVYCICFVLQCIVLRSITLCPGCIVLHGCIAWFRNDMCAITTRQFMLTIPVVTLPFGLSRVWRLTVDDKSFRIRWFVEMDKLSRRTIKRHARCLATVGIYMAPFIRPCWGI